MNKGTQPSWRDYRGCYITHRVTPGAPQATESGIGRQHARRDPWGEAPSLSLERLGAMSSSEAPDGPPCPYAPGQLCS